MNHSTYNAGTAPTSPPTVPQSPADAALLLEFVKDRDVLCPRCDYNLRNLTQPICPECREWLILKVGTQRTRVHWLLLSIAPGMFAAIAVLIFFVMSAIHGFPPMPLEGVAVMLFLGVSGVVAVTLAIKASWFLRRADQTQVIWAAVTWSIHLLAFAIFAVNA
jgi:hypothetical protein